MRYGSSPITTAILLSCAGFSGCGVVDRFTKASDGSPVEENSPRLVSFIEAPSVDLGTISLSATRFFRILISTTGSGDANLVSTVHSNARFTFNGGAFPGIGGTCTQPIQGNCSLAIQFTAPSSVGDAGIYSDVLTLTYQSNNVIHSTSITTIATVVPGAYLAVSGNANFGVKNVGSTTDETLSVLNAGALTATGITASGFSAPLTFKGGSYPGIGGSCGSSLSPLASCTVVTNYTPVTAGATSNTLALNYSSASNAETSYFPMTGTAVALASLSITSPVTNPFDFGPVVIGAAAVNQLFTLKNNGGQTATALAATGLAAPFTFRGGSYPGTSANCGTTLTAGASCTIAVSFSPSTPGSASDSLDISYSDGTVTQNLSEGLTGTGTNAAVLSITPGPSFDYGTKTIGTTTAQTFVVTNSGGSSAKTMSATALPAPFRFKGSTYPGTGGSCATILASAVTCTLIVEFIPTAVGTFNQTITLTYNDGVAAINTTGALTGTGGDLATLTLSDGPTFDFGTVAKSYRNEHIFTVTQSGSVPATALSGAALSAPFSYKGGTYPGTGGNCGTTLGTAGTCLLAVTFTPTTLVGSNATLTLNYNNGSVATSATRPLSGVGAGILKIVGGGEHTCALYTTGIVRCWGSNFNGQLGDGNSATYSAIPVTVLGINTATDIAAGSNHSCALLANQRIQCWGADSSGQLGNDAALAESHLPVYIFTGAADFTQVSAGADVSCGLRAAGTVLCWGADGEGANGNNAAFLNNAVPVTVSGLTGATHLSVGRGHACAVRTGNTVRCWGANANGQIGMNTTTNSGVSLQIPSFTASLVVAGGDTSCGVQIDGSLRCWGSGNYGQLANGNTTGFEKIPTVIPALDQFQKISLGRKHGCALNASNAVTCWGRDNYGQLGDNVGATDEPLPVLAGGMNAVSLVGTGENHSCAVKITGEAYCWGANASGQLGNTPLSTQPLPVSVLGL